MDKEKAKKKLAKANSKNPKAGIKEYFKGVKTEMKKVVWPTRKELGSYTGVVILTSVLLSLAIWAIDSTFLASLKYALNISF